MTAFREVRNPNDKSMGYVLHDTGLIEPIGLAPPIVGTPQYFNTVLPPNAVAGPARAIQITDWVGPGGYVLAWDGTVTQFGTATAPAAQAVDVPFTAFGQVAPIAIDFAMDPSGDGKGYILSLDGRVRSVAGAPGVAGADAKFSLGTSGEWAWRMVMDYGSKKFYILTMYGRVLEYNGATKITIIDGNVGWDFNTMWPPSWPYAHGRALVIDNWTSGAGYMLDAWGGAHFLDGAQNASTNQPYWQGNEWAWDLNVLDDGTGPTPLSLTTLTFDGYTHPWTVAGAPVITLLGIGLVAPGGTVTTSTRPLIYWDYNNTFDDGQKLVVARIFSNAQHGIGGFNPASSPFTVEVSTDDPTLRGFVPPLDLPGSAGSPQTWWVYLQVTSAADVSTAWGVAGSYGSWVQSVTYPPQPTVTATPGAHDVDGISVLVHTTAAPGAGVSFGVQYMDMDVFPNDEWRWVRGGEALTPDGGHNATIVDYEARYGVERLYRAIAYSMPSNVIIAGGFGTDSAKLTERTDWTLTNPYDHTDGGIIYVMPDFEFEERLDAYAVWPSGSSKAIVMVDSAPVKGLSSTLTLMLTNATEYDKFRPLLLSGLELLLRDPFGRGWYVSVAGGDLKSVMPSVPPEDCSDEDQPSGAGFYHQVDVPVVEVARPATADANLDGLLV